METGHPSTRAVNSGSGNRALRGRIHRAGLCTAVMCCIVGWQSSVIEQISTQVRRHHSRADGASDGVSSLYCSLRHRWSSSSSLAPETSTPCRQKLGACLVVWQRSHVPHWRHRVATQPSDACSFLRCWLVN